MHVRGHVHVRDAFWVFFLHEYCHSRSSGHAVDSISSAHLHVRPTCIVRVDGLAKLPQKNHTFSRGDFFTALARAALVAVVRVVPVPVQSAGAVRWRTRGGQFDLDLNLVRLPARTAHPCAAHVKILVARLTKRRNIN